jgi:hypothetical protein
MRLQTAAAIFPPLAVLATCLCGLIASGIDKVTWQPRPRVRIATVSVPWRGGTVTAGRSLRVVEEQEAALELLVGAGWLATLVALAISSAVSAWILARGRMPTRA